MRYLHTMVRIADVDASLRFYCDLLGMKEARRIENEKGRFTLIFLDADEDHERAKETRSPQLELTYNWPDEKGEGERPTQGSRNWGHLAYVVDDIYETCRRLQEGGVVINRPPRDGHMAFVKSPDGISIELLQHGEAKAPAEPWASMENTGSW